MERFEKALKLYKSKYEMTVNSVLQFIRSKTDSEPEVLRNIEEMIMSYHKSRGEFISEDQLKDYFHLVAAAQAKVNIFSNQIEDVRKYHQIKFKSKKEPSKKEEKTGQGKESSKETEKKHSHKEEEKKHSHKEEEKKHSHKEEEKKHIHKEEERKMHQHHREGEIRREKEREEVRKEKEKVKQEIEEQRKKESREETTKPQGSYRSPQKPKDPSPYPELGTIQENVVEEDRTSNYFKPSPSEQFFVKHPEVQMMQLKMNNKPVQIRGYDKFGQNYFQPIIKFRVVYKDKAVYRRYTQFENLMKYLNRRYEGFILPELPPKEGLKSNLSYFYGVDETFLNDRQNKLQDMMNVLLTSKFINEDEILLNFITNSDYQISSGENEGTLDYLRSLGEIAFNAKELKSYGMAYYNYFKSFKKSDISTQVTDCYKNAEPVLSYCLEMEGYRSAIIANFDKRREIFKELEVDKADRTLTITEFDKVSAASAAQVRNLQKEMNKYYQLKSQESWLKYLIDQKQYQNDTTLQDLKHRHGEIQGRLLKMEKNLINSIDYLVDEKKRFLNDVAQLMFKWRKCIHP